MSPFNHKMILLADWKSERRRRIKKNLHPGFKLEMAESPEKVIAAVERSSPHIVIFPLRWYSSEAISPLVQCAGFKVMQRMSVLKPHPEIILFDPAVKALSLSDYCLPFQKGAAAFWDENDPGFAENLKKITGAHFMRHIHSSGISVDMGSQSLRLEGESPAMGNVRDFIKKTTVLSDFPVLITGKSGTGKELVARAIHQLDPKRKNKPFIAVNCSAITQSLSESLFFGHRRGAFTGATGEQSGYFRAAQGGTLFLDEISELDLALQPKILRVLQEKKVVRVGEEMEQTIDVRIIAASNKDLPEQVAQGAFRLDLYHRLDVLSLRVPTLKERKEDIAPLFWAFLKKHAACYPRVIEGIHPRVIELLKTLEFEGNVRELENIARKILFQKTVGDVIEMADLPSEILKQAIPHKLVQEEDVLEVFLTSQIKQGASLSQVMMECEKRLIKTLLHEVGKNQVKTAKQLKITPRTLFNKVRRYNL
ncbi:Response regulator of zinc sigma-54-dependent two-component system [hydrothermal vent metagenome]|uniref:Response regulator of zinc sigma-54-dependent two-component system n=1 Tax=hydrothermal vent metagenome TaxID=652676 RepID=A0A3B1CXH7_9ZZZZ